MEGNQDKFFKPENVTPEVVMRNVANDNKSPHAEVNDPEIPWQGVFTPKETTRRNDAALGIEQPQQEEDDLDTAQGD